MATKITGYGVFKSSGGNKCIHCNTRMRKGLPYLSPITGKRVIRELKGKSICVSCIKMVVENVDTKLQDCGIKSLEKFEQRRFLEHLDKD